jgi:hypothetical protein
MVPILPLRNGTVGRVPVARALVVVTLKESVCVDHWCVSRISGSLASHRLGVGSRIVSRLGRNAAAVQNSLRTVVPDLHVNDQAVSDDETVDISVAFKRGSVRPSAV